MTHCHVRCHLAGTAVIALMALSTHAQPAPAYAPLLGRWVLSKAVVDASSRMSVTRSGTGEFTYTALGQTMTFKIDGTDFPAPMGMSVAWTQPGPREWVATFRIKGTVVNTDTHTLSADGRTLTVRTDWKDRPDHGTQSATWVRTSGSADLVGEWEAKGLDSDARAEFTAEGGRLRMHLMPPDQNCLVDVDGKDYPCTTAGSAVPGLTMNLRQVGPRSFEATAKQDGTPFQWAILTAPVGDTTLEVDVRSGATSTDRTKLIYTRR